MKKNTRTLFILAAVVGVMIGLVSQAEPLYKMFCGAAGLYGTTQNATAAPGQTNDRMITVTFDGHPDEALPWEFAPETKSVRVKLGEVKTIKYRAKNLGNRTIAGWAVHNVQPDKAGLYFDKIQCFCMRNQVLNPGQSAELPVQFFIDPAIAKDRNENDVTDITLSYTFYVAKDQQAAINQMHMSSSDKANHSSGDQ